MADRDGRRLGTVIDSVAWDYDPEAENLSPLVSTRRYFRDFPWEPEELPQRPGLAPAVEADGERGGD